MSFYSDWKRAAAATFIPLPLVLLAITLGLNIAAYRAPVGGWQVLLLLCAGIAATAFGGIVMKKYFAAPSPLALKAESADAMIGIARKSLDKRHGGVSIIDDILAQAQTELRIRDQVHE